MKRNNKRKLTDKQQKVYDYFLKFKNENGKFIYVENHSAYRLEVAKSLIKKGYLEKLDKKYHCYEAHLFRAIKQD